MTRYKNCFHCEKPIRFWQRYEIVGFDSVYGEFFTDKCVHKKCYKPYRENNPKRNTTEQWVLDKEKELG